MYRSFTIRNFRCFRDLTIEPLERVNLIAGRNNVGKTALLEAMALLSAANGSRSALGYDASRGMQTLSQERDPAWDWLYHQRTADEGLEIAATDCSGVTASLRVTLGADSYRSIRRPLSASYVEEAPTVVYAAPVLIAARELHLHYRDSTGRHGKVAIKVAEDGGRMATAEVPGLAPVVFLLASTRDHVKDAERFSDLVRQGRDGEVADVLRVLEPRLRRLDVLESGGAWLVHGDIGIGEFVPMPLMGEGTGRLLSILLSVASAAGGMALVDEIENGLHYSVLVDVWRAIGDTARRSDTQVFATTHSWECIVAAHEAFAASGTYDLRLHRLDRVDDDVRAMTYSQEMLETAILAGLEVR